MKILIAEDDPNTRDGLREILEEEGYTVITAADGEEGLERYRENRPDLACLDIMMPGLSGYEVCREMRRDKGEIPVIFISAKSEEIDRVVGLEMGADDYISKPFGVREVVARIRAVTRRMRRQDRSADSATFVMDDLKVVPMELRAYRDGEVIDLSLRDVGILKLFYNCRGSVLDRDRIMDECWGIDYMPNSRALDQHISQLRKRIEMDPAHPRIIQTVHGAGYRFE